MASKAPSPSSKKSTKRRASAGKARRGQGAAKARKSAGDKAAGYVPRAISITDDDDVLMSTGAGGGAGFGRCGGRLLGSRLEQTLCDGLSRAGVAHSHSPRHFEVRVDDRAVAAYAPMIVLRGRGREGKSVVLEAAETASSQITRKVSAFRGQYGPEFYLIFVAPEDVLDSIPLSAYDESCSTNNLNTLISRLAE